jgi:3-hydroxyisobutyrate dehydrogenase-like beta-hydroxyacid dehydrogenase
VSGGQAGAVNGQLGIMCGGEAATFDKAKPVIDVYAKLAALIGGPGSGQLTKMVNQLCIVASPDRSPKRSPSPGERARPRRSSA